MELYETKIKKFSGLCCKIQMRNVSGIWQQRHIWYPPTPYITEETINPWIRSVQIPPQSHFHLVEDDTEMEDDTMANRVNITLRPKNGILYMYLDTYDGSFGYLQEMNDKTWSATIDGGRGGNAGFSAKTQSLVLAKVRKYFNDK